MVGPKSNAIFYLTYEELLTRKKGYEVVLNFILPKPIRNLNVEVLLSFLNVFNLSKRNLQSPCKEI